MRLTSEQKERLVVFEGARLLINRALSVLFFTVPFTGDLVTYTVAPCYPLPAGIPNMPNTCVGQQLCRWKNVTWYAINPPEIQLPFSPNGYGFQWHPLHGILTHGISIVVPQYSGNGYEVTINLFCSRDL
jgi:hypothetical protein